MKVVLFADGGARGNPGLAAGAAVIFAADRVTVLARVSRVFRHATNNQAEYAGLILGLAKARELGATEIAIYLDSKLVIEQVAGRWKVRNSELARACTRAQTLLREFTHVTLDHVPRAQNHVADALVNFALDAKKIPQRV